jgi:glycosyltransferase involved in cell wall biosynthesis
MEKVVLKDADLVVTVSSPWAQRIAASLGAKDKVKVIENGYDEEDFSDTRYEGNEKLTFVYTGKLHKEHQPIDNFLKALRELIDEKRIDPKGIEARFYVFGYDKPDVKGLVASYGLGGIVTEVPRVGYEESLRVQRKSDVLLFVQWQGRGGDGWYSAKLYDYIGARRPILALAERGGIIEDIIARTASGLIARGDAELKKAISEFYLEHKANHKINYKGSEGEISKNTRLHRARELAKLFNGLVGE